MMPYNFTQPTYWKFFQDVFSTATNSWYDLDSHYKNPINWWSIIETYSQVQKCDIIYVIILALMWTVVRKTLTFCLFLPIVKKCGLNGDEAVKAPESAWKFSFYLCTWLYSIHVLFYTENNFFYDVPSTFIGWKINNEVPSKIYAAYLIQFSFYVHSVYATLYMDLWRKDSIVMLMHHFVTMFLIGFSYAFRYTSVGMLILFLHDVTDVILEGTKLAVYFKTKGGLWHTVCDGLSTVGFILFGLSWYIFRLYWFPLKAMYASGYISKKAAPDIIFYHFFNLLLWILLSMNIYWFMFIVKMAYRIVTKQVDEVDDTREYSNDGISKQKKWN